MDLTDIIDIINKKIEEIRINGTTMSTSLSELFKLYEKLAKIKTSKESPLSDEELSRVEELLIPNMNNGFVRIKDALYNDRGRSFNGLDEYLENLVHYDISRGVTDALSIRSLSNYIINEANIGLYEYRGLRDSKKTNL